MDFTMEDTQNAAPEAHEASKLAPSAQRTDTQSVTKRYVNNLTTSASTQRSSVEAG